MFRAPAYLRLRPATAEVEVEVFMVTFSEWVVRKILRESRFDESGDRIRGFSELVPGVRSANSRRPNDTVSQVLI
ncbi:hypothetical protein C7458_11514 [Williamsia muralis]|nr:hypothetical protein C7458_11514 [Williamsia marianensis]